MKKIKAEGCPAIADKDIKSMDSDSTAEESGGENECFPKEFYLATALEPHADYCPYTTEPLNLSILLHPQYAEYAPNNRYV